MIDEPDRRSTPASDDETRELFWEAMANTLRPYTGWFFYGFGALLVLIGYFGISGEALVAKQLPYLISGGIGGILLAILGAYFLGMEELRRDGGRLDRMEKQVEELHRLLLERPDAPALTVPAAAEPSTSNGAGKGKGKVVVVEAGESYHRPDCTLVSGKAATALEPRQAASQGLRRCPVCEPALTAS